MAIADALNFDGCCHVYVDVGSNVGVQVRKLYEPSLYPNSKMFPVFDKLFGHASKRRHNTCAVGMEASPRHARVLHNIEAAYRALGWRTDFLAPAAAGTSNEPTTFFLDDSRERWAKGTEWWASTISHEFQHRAGAKAQNVTVPTVDLANFLEQRVLLRKRPPGCTVGRVVMKVDIEGSEYSVLPHLLSRGVLCRLDFVAAEFHEREMGRPEQPQHLVKQPRFAVIGDKLGVPLNYAAAFRFTVKNAGPHCKVRVSSIDDEAHHGSVRPLPNATTYAGH